MLFSPFDGKSVVFGKRGFLQSDAIELLLVELDGRVHPQGSHFLVEDVLDVIGSVGVVGGGLSYSFDRGAGAVFVFEGQ